MLPVWKSILISALMAARVAAGGISLDVSSAASIKTAASTIASDLMGIYNSFVASNPGGIGTLPKPYYWWEAGAMFGSMIAYTHFTNDNTYAATIGNAILSQASPTNDFMMTNQRFDLGNDDQVFWAMTAMSGVEYAFPVPPSTDPNAYLNLAVNVFNDMVPRWNTSLCNGGFKWQFNPENKGFDYKSSIANGGFFQLAARLALHTGNSTYSDWATKTWTWMTDIGFIDSSTSAVYDGAGDANNCAQIGHVQWSYNAAVFLYGAAAMASLPASTLPADQAATWLARTQGLLHHSAAQFFTPFPNATNIMYESQCETVGTCNTDQFSFKAYLSRWLAASAALVPALRADVAALLVPSAKAAAASCVPGTGCGSKWYVGGFDGVTGVGQDMSALEAVLGLLAGGSDVITPVVAPKAADTAAAVTPAVAVAAAAATTLTTLTTASSTATAASASSAAPAAVVVDSNGVGVCLRAR